MEVVREREEYKDTEGDERERPSKEYIDKAKCTARSLCELQNVRNLLDALDVNPAARDLALNILEEEGGTAMQAFINAQIAAAAAEEMQRQKHELGEFAKGTVMDLLQAERAPQMMASLFREPSMCATVRTGVQWGLETPYVYDKVTELFEWILNGYLLADGAANEWSREEAAKEAVAPLLAWVLTPEGELDESVLHAVMTALPWMQPSVNETMAWAVDETLKADDYKEYAKGIIVEMLKSQGAQAAANAQAEAHLQRAKARSSKDSITILAGTKDSDHPALDDFASRVRDKGEEALADLKLDTTDSEEDQVGDDSDIGASFNKDANVHKGRPQGGGAARDDGESADGADGQVS
ncbi:hypothetical protein JKP88DRAFT_264788 [Tribonema minus]|uniref:Uncharacterized protein n=1 Tax=Tribonema minus TaxID=303371 RepID=A0A835YMT8_9STRA|nr:hypothetical protein JKP88DRAFT_264788 [Tribonema minus]